MDKIIIYTNETCPYCKAIKEQFKNKKIDFEERLTKDFTKKWQEIINLTGLSTVPTVEYKDEYFIPNRDFGNPNQIINILDTFEQSKHNDSRRTLERIKTLNFNINTAFGRLDKLLREIETKINKDEHKSTN